MTTTACVACLPTLFSHLFLLPPQPCKEGGGGICEADCWRYTHSMHQHRVSFPCRFGETFEGKNVFNYFRGNCSNAVVADLKGEKWPQQT